MDKLIGQSIEQFYAFLIDCLTVICLCFRKPKDLVHKIFAQPHEDPHSDENASRHGTPSNSRHETDLPQKNRLPSPFHYIVFLSLVSAILTEYMVILVLTSSVQSFVVVMDSITFSRILAYTFLPFLFVFSVSRIVAWIVRKFNSDLEAERFTTFFCYSTGFQMSIAIGLSGFVLLLIAVNEWGTCPGGWASWLLALLRFPFVWLSGLLRDWFYPIGTLLLFIGGVWVITPFGARLFKGGGRGFLFACALSPVFFSAIPISLISFVIDRHMSYIYDQKGISILVCGIEYAESLPESQTCADPGTKGKQGGAPPDDCKDKNQKKKCIVMNVLLRNEGEEWYYIKRCNAKVSLEVDGETRLSGIPCHIAVVATDDSNQAMVTLEPRKGEKWVTIHTDTREAELEQSLRRQFPATITGAKLIFEFCYATGMNLYENQVSIGKFSTKLHYQWVSPFSQLRGDEPLSLCE